VLPLLLLPKPEELPEVEEKPEEEKPEEEKPDEDEPVLLPEKPEEDEVPGPPLEPSSPSRKVVWSSPLASVRARSSGVRPPQATAVTRVRQIADDSRFMGGKDRVLILRMAFVGRIRHWIVNSSALRPCPLRPRAALPATRQGREHDSSRSGGPRTTSEADRSRCDEDPSSSKEDPSTCEEELTSSDEARSRSGIDGSGREEDPSRSERDHTRYGRRHSPCDDDGSSRDGLRLSCGLRCTHWGALRHSRDPLRSNWDPSPSRRDPLHYACLPLHCGSDPLHT
jgi:hypothetical protein